MIDLFPFSIALCSGDLPPMSAMSSFVAATATPFIGQTFSEGDTAEEREVQKMGEREKTQANYR